MSGRFRCRQFLVSIVALFSMCEVRPHLLYAQSSAAQTKAAEQPSLEITCKARVASPMVIVLRDTGVRRELKLSASQVQKLDEALKGVAYPLWYVRDSRDAATLADCARAHDHLEEHLLKILDLKQRQRFYGILLQAQGWPVVLTPRIANDLNLSLAQQTRIADLLTEAATPPGETVAGEKQLEAGQRDAHDEIKKVLGEAQQGRLRKLVGTPFDVASIRSRHCPAPSVQPVEEWINSEPLDWEKMRGKVVAVHYWAFGCINCVRNLRHYQSWHARYAEQGLVILGFHTPETQAERVVESVRAKVKSNGMLYPVAIDGQAKNWSAWSNRWWPSVYLVDKKGYVRYWWYGELNWQGAKGEEFMRLKIEELLSEQD